MPIINIKTTKGGKETGEVNAEVTFRPKLNLADISFPPNLRSQNPSVQTVTAEKIPNLLKQSVFDNLDGTRDTFTRLL